MIRQLALFLVSLGFQYLYLFGPISFHPSIRGFFSPQQRRPKKDKKNSAFPSMEFHADLFLAHPFTTKTFQSFAHSQNNRYIHCVAIWNCKFIRSIGSPCIGCSICFWTKHTLMIYLIIPGNPLCVGSCRPSGRLFCSWPIHADR